MNAVRDHHQSNCGAPMGVLSALSTRLQTSASTASSDSCILKQQQQQQQPVMLGTADY